jgi:hypothetical protein
MFGVVGCFSKDSEGIKLSKEPFDKAKCALYRSTAEEALNKNEMDIVNALRNYNTQCAMNTDKIKDASKTKGKADPL